MSNSLDPDQAQQFIEPDLDNLMVCRLSADYTWKKTVKVIGPSKLIVEWFPE